MRESAWRQTLRCATTPQKSLPAMILNGSVLLRKLYVFLRRGR